VRGRVGSASECVSTRGNRFLGKKRAISENKRPVFVIKTGRTEVGLRALSAFAPKISFLHDDGAQVLPVFSAGDAPGCAPRDQRRIDAEFDRFWELIGGRRDEVNQMLPRMRLIIHNQVRLRDRIADVCRRSTTRTQ